MKDSDIKLIEEVLYSENVLSALRTIKSIVDKEILHAIAVKYNWDDGFEIPTAIIRHEKCDLSTALFIFYLADGYRFLANQNDVNESSNVIWKDFSNELYRKIIDNEFTTQEISFTPPLTSVQAFKLRKQNRQIPACFFESVMES